ncbi:Dfp1/Him1, central region-domain-containing protein [Lipomyces arxii]|uniref:Dfp1/Him1, central region-domain-containing protein n=1 Tax=Lipomyces arxii TaxID=56418 RepID=UPI0034CDF6D1
MSSVSPAMSRQSPSTCATTVARSPIAMAGALKRDRSHSATKDLSKSTNSTSSASDTSRQKFSLGKTMASSAAAACVAVSSISHAGSATGQFTARLSSSANEYRPGSAVEELLNGSANPESGSVSANSESQSSLLATRNSSHQRRPSTFLNANGLFYEQSRSTTESMAFSASASITQLAERQRDPLKDARHKGAISGLSTFKSIRDGDRSGLRVKESLREKERVRVQQQSKDVATATTQSNDREAETVRLWQRQWKKVLSTSAFYFDAIDEPSKEKMPNKDKIKKQLVSLGTTIETFFHGEISHVVSNRPVTGVYAPTDIIFQAVQRGMKIWTYSKLERFMNHLNENTYATTGTSASHTGNCVSRGQVVVSETSNNLTRMLREEKLSGVVDTVREDFQLFRGPYINIRDYLKPQCRPIMTREHKRAADPAQGDWPQFRVTARGRCPFVPDMSQRVAEEVKLQHGGTQSLKRSAASKIKDVTSKGAHKARKVAAALAYDDKDEDNSAEENEADDEVDIDDSMRRQSVSAAFKEPPPPKRSVLTPVKMTSARLNSNGKTTELVTKKQALIATDKSYQERMAKVLAHETIATGVNMSNVTSNIRSMSQSGGAANGLAAMMSHTQSKEVISLKRKVFERKRRPMPVPQMALTKESVAIKDMKPGYCENCKDRFDDYDEHAHSRKHRKYAYNDDNFGDVDEFMAQVVRALHKVEA